MKHIKFLSILLALIPATISASSWTYSFAEDVFNDSTQHRAVIRLDNSKAFGFVRCSNNSSLDIAFSLDKYIGSENRYSVRYRFDKKSVVQSDWGVSTNGTEVFVSNNEVIRFSRDLMSGRELLLEVTDYRGTPNQLKYPLAGSTAAVSKVLAACGIPIEEPKLSIDPDKVTPLVKTAMANWLPNDIKCNNASLKILGYELNELGAQITVDSYYAMQRYFDKTYLKECGPETKSVYEKTYDCQSKERFMSSRVIVLLNREAAQLDRDSYQKSCAN